MSPEEVLAALDSKAVECRDLLADMRSMEKTLRTTQREVAAFIAQETEALVMSYLKMRADEHFMIYQKEYDELQEKVLHILTTKMARFINDTTNRMIDIGVI